MKEKAKEKGELFLYNYAEGCFITSNGIKKLLETFDFNSARSACQKFLDENPGNIPDLLLSSKFKDNPFRGIEFVLGEISLEDVKTSVATFDIEFGVAPNCILLPPKNFHRATLIGLEFLLGLKIMSSGKNKFGAALIKLNKENQK